jgi:hypothetical protein
MDFSKKTNLVISILYILYTELMTTPQLHYTVRCKNDSGLYGHPTEAGYFNKLCTAFQKLIGVKSRFSNDRFYHYYLDDTWC